MRYSVYLLAIALIALLPITVNAGYSESATSIEKSENKKAGETAQRLQNEIKRLEKEYKQLGDGELPAIKERKLQEIKIRISEYNEFASRFGIKPYESIIPDLNDMAENSNNNSFDGVRDVVIGGSSSANEISALPSVSPQKESNSKNEKKSVDTPSKSNEAITLTVSSDGPTKDDAVKNALRLAIEQAYGAFVSANTTILNDELVKDEIVTITHGAIKEFQEVAGAQLPDNRYNVTLKATVSLPNLITYAKNHGSECEFAGNTFAMQMKLYELQKQNELKALENLRETLKPMITSGMHWEIEVGEPKVDTKEGNLIDKWAKGTVFSRDLNGKFLVKEDEYLYKENPALFNNDNGKIMKLKREDYYLVPISIYASVLDGTFDSEGNPNEPLYNYIKNTLASVSMSKDECEWAKAKGLAITSHSWGNDSFYCKRLIDSRYYFRNKEAQDIIYDIYNIIALNSLNFAIEDNLGNRHRCYFYVDGPTCTNSHGDCKFGDNLGELLPQNLKFPTIFDLGNWKSPRVVNDEQSLFYVPILDYKYGNIIDPGPYDIPGLYEHIDKGSKILSSPHVLQREVAHFYMRIPKNEIGKYSSFKVVRDLDLSELYGK